MAPPQMQALVAADAHRAEVQLVQTPEPETNEALIKVNAVTVNPTDWKHVAFMAPPGVIVGCDFCGVVDSLGPDAKGSIKKGDKVAGFVHGSKDKDRGSFAEYLKTGSELVMTVPEGVHEEEASSVGIAGTTAVQALYHRLGLTKPDPSKGKPTLTADSPELLVWAGSTAVGQFAIQLGRLSGYRVITTASPKNHDFVKSLGADEAYDYKDESTPDKIREAHPKLAAALDCISEGGTTVKAVRSLGSSGGEVVVLLKPEKEAVALRNDVKVTHTLIYTALGRTFAYGRTEFGAEQVAADSAKMKEWLNGDQGIYYHLFKNGLIKGNRIKHMDGGIQSITEGFKYMQDGKISAEKLAYRISV